LHKLRAVIASAAKQFMNFSRVDCRVASFPEVREVASLQDDNQALPEFSPCPDIF
jgi:hypothetical protein